MSTRLSFLFLLALVAAGAGLLSNPAVANIPKPTITQEWNFKVFLDDKEIGFHDYRVIGQGESRRVETEASFDVKILFFNAYSYRHNNVETWDADCLTNIDAATDANGDRFSVMGESRDDAFVVRTADSESNLPACVMSFAYWNPEMLRATRLLNSQTGEFERVDVRSLGRDSVRYGDETVAAQRYDLLVNDQAVSLWYADDDGRWLALESPARGGRTIRYEPVLLPPASVGANGGDAEVSDNG